MERKSFESTNNQKISNFELKLQLLDQTQIIHLILAFSWAFFVVLFAIPSIIYLAHVKNLLDVPNKRTVHASLTPRLGGLAIFAGFVSSITLFGDFGENSFGAQQVLASTIILFFIGLKDDISPVSATKKFFVQILSISIVVFAGDVRISSFQGVLGLGQMEEGLSILFTIFVMVGITNAINLIDGLDGLAGMLVLTFTCIFGFFFFTGSVAYGVLSVCLAGAIVGFLRYNLYKATIFMGDTGSLLLGFITSVLAVEFVELKLVSHSPVIALSVLIVPVADTLRVFLLRALDGLSPFVPDRRHIHHRLIDFGFSQISVVFILVLLTLAFSGLSLFLAEKASINMLLIIVSVLAVLLSISLELIYKLRKK